MSYRLRITEQALDDIQRNAAWWANHHSRSQALRWYEAILDRIKRLVDFPESHALAYENPYVPYDLREALFGLGSRPGYRILFTVADDEVIVLTVKAAEEDWLRPSDLPPLPPSSE